MRKRPRSITLNAKLGIFFEGEFYHTDTDTYRTFDSGTVFSVAADTMVANKLSLGVFLLIVSTNTYDTDVTITTLGTTIKARFLVAGLELRPGVAFGYNSIDVAEIGTFEGFDVAALFETAVPLADHVDVVGELSFLTQPAGDGATWGPIFFTTIGLEIGFE